MLTSTNFWFGVAGGFIICWFYHRKMAKPAAM